MDGVPRVPELPFYGADGRGEVAPPTSGRSTTSAGFLSPRRTTAGGLSLPLLSSIEGCLRSLVVGTRERKSSATRETSATGSTCSPSATRWRDYTGGPGADLRGVRAMTAGVGFQLGAEMSAMAFRSAGDLDLLCKFSSTSGRPSSAAPPRWVCCWRRGARRGTAACST
jgi:hypothetical protein